MCLYIVTGSATLRLLNVSWNGIGDDGIVIILEALQNNKSLTKLNVCECGLSVKGNVVCGFIRDSYICSYTQCS